MQSWNTEKAAGPAQSPPTPLGLFLGLGHELGVFIPPRTQAATDPSTFRQPTRRSKSGGWVGNPPFLQSCWSFSDVLLLSLLKIPEIIFFPGFQPPKRKGRLETLLFVKALRDFVPAFGVLVAGLGFTSHGECQQIIYFSLQEFLEGFLSHQ